MLVKTSCSVPWMAWKQGNFFCHYWYSKLPIYVTERKEENELPLASLFLISTAKGARSNQPPRTPWTRRLIGRKQEHRERKKSEPFFPHSARPLFYKFFPFVTTTLRFEKVLPFSLFQSVNSLFICTVCFRVCASLLLWDKYGSATRDDDCRGPR